MPPGPPPPSSRPRSHSSRSARTAELLVQVGATDDPQRRDRLLEEVTVLNVPMAESVASRYRGRGIGGDDLDGVARLALVKAVQRFDVEAGHDFLSYAVPTIRGEIRRYFRDHGWMVRPPRRIQEVQASIASVEVEVGAALGRAPRPSELAEALDTDVTDVEEALTAQGCFAPASLDRPVSEAHDPVLGGTRHSRPHAHRSRPSGTAGPDRPVSATGVERGRRRGSVPPTSHPASGTTR